MRQTLSPRVILGVGAHEDHESAICLISGEAEMWWDEALNHHAKLAAGHFVYIPAGVPHLPANRSQTEPATAVVARTDPNEQESVVSGRTWTPSWRGTGAEERPAAPLANRWASAARRAKGGPVADQP